MDSVSLSSEFGGVSTSRWISASAAGLSTKERCKPLRRAAASGSAAQAVSNSSAQEARLRMCV